MRSLVIAVGLLTLVGCGNRDGRADQDPEDLWGRAFVSTEVTKDGEHRPLLLDTRIEVTFERRGVLGFQAGCNLHGADLEIRSERLVVGQIESTAIGCPGGLEEQDRWLASVFDSDPRWELRGDRLILSADRSVIELEGTRDR